jgi:hypothetical protein
MLHGDGKMEYLVLNPETSTSGTYYWTASYSEGQESAEWYFPNSEGIDVYEDRMYFVSKEIYTMFILELDSNTYTSHSTSNGAFEGQPDQIERLCGADDDLLYFTEDGGDYAGVHARDLNGNFITILESYQYSDEVSGLSKFSKLLQLKRKFTSFNRLYFVSGFDPSGKHMYISYQDDGLLFDITRTDGLSFGAKVLNVKHHKKKRRLDPVRRS